MAKKKATPRNASRKKAAKKRNRSTAVDPSAINMAEQRKWQAEEDLRTLRRAAEVTADASRMDAATRIARLEAAALAKIGGKGKKKAAKA